MSEAKKPVAKKPVAKKPATKTVAKSAAKPAAAKPAAAKTAVAAVNPSGVTASIARRSMALAYSVPVIGGTVALILGMIVVDATNTGLTGWAWALIHAILAVSLVLGAWHSDIADSFTLKSGKKVGATRGAHIMNLVLSIVWAGLGTLQAFSLGQEGVAKLGYWRAVPVEETPAGKPDYIDQMTINPLTLEAFVNDWLPPFVILLIVMAGIYLTLWARNRKVS